MNRYGLFPTYEEDYNTAKDDANRLKDDMDNYADSRTSTGYHARQDEWEIKYKEAKERYDAAVKVRESKRKDYEKAITNHTRAKNAVSNYKKAQDVIISDFLIEMLKPNPSVESLEKYINELNSVLVDFGDNDDIIDNYSELVEKTQTLSNVVKDYTSLVSAAKKDDDNIEYLKENLMDDITVPDPKSDSFNDNYVEWRAEWTKKLNTLENLIQKLPKFSKNKEEYLENSLINVELLLDYNSDEKMHDIDEIRRNKVSDINVMERAWNLLRGKYRFTAWFSFAVALFFDLSSLLVGLFIYGIRKRRSRKQ